MYDFTVDGIKGEKKNLGEYKGKVALVVNTASECGYTPQYKGLEDLHQKFGKQGFTVLAFPSNDFGAQEPGSNAQIKEFCELRYKTTFPLFGKSVVKGSDKTPLFNWLTTSGGNDALKGEISWNFEKFLVSGDGEVVARFKSSVEPMAKELVDAVEATLKKSE